MDDFELAASSYDVDDFYIASTNKKGQYRTWRMNIPPEVSAEIGALVASRQIPEFRTAQDFGRDALVHQLKRIQDKTTGGINLRLGMLARNLIIESTYEKILIVTQSVGRRRDMLTKARAMLRENPDKTFIFPLLFEALEVEQDPELRGMIQEMLDEFNE